MTAKALAFLPCKECQKPSVLTTDDGDWCEEHRPKSGVIPMAEVEHEEALGHRKASTQGRARPVLSPETSAVLERVRKARTVVPSDDSLIQEGLRKLLKE